MLKNRENTAQKFAHPNNASSVGGNFKIFKFAVSRHKRQPGLVRTQVFKLFNRIYEVAIYKPRRNYALILQVSENNRVENTAHANQNQGRQAEPQSPVLFTPAQNNTCARFHRLAENKFQPRRV